MLHPPASLAQRKQVPSFIPNTFSAVKCYFCMMSLKCFPLFTPWWKEWRSESAHMNTWAWLLAWILGWGSCLNPSCGNFNCTPFPSAPHQALGASVVPQLGYGKISRGKLHQQTPACRKGLCRKEIQRICCFYLFSSLSLLKCKCQPWRQLSHAVQYTEKHFPHHKWKEKGFLVIIWCTKDKTEPGLCALP